MLSSLSLAWGKIKLLLRSSMNQSAVEELLKLAKDRSNSNSVAGYWQAIYDAAEVSLGIDDEEDPDRVSALAMKFHERVSGKTL